MVETDKSKLKSPSIILYTLKLSINLAYNVPNTIFSIQYGL